MSEREEEKRDKLVYSVSTSRGIVIFTVNKVEDVKPLIDKADLDDIDSWAPLVEYPFQDINSVVDEIVHRSGWTNKIR